MYTYLCLCLKLQVWSAHKYFYICSSVHKVFPILPFLCLSICRIFSETFQIFNHVNFFLFFYFHFWTKVWTLLNQNCSPPTWLGTIPNKHKKPNPFQIQDAQAIAHFAFHMGICWHLYVRNKSSKVLPNFVFVSNAPEELSVYSKNDDVTEWKALSISCNRFQNTRTTQKERGILCWRLLTKQTIFHNHDVGLKSVLCWLGMRFCTLKLPKLNYLVNKFSAICLRLVTP